MGKILGGGGGTKAKPASPYKAAQFQPYTYTSQLGTTTGVPEGDSGFNVSSAIDPNLEGVGGSALQYPEPFINAFAQQANRQLPMFSGVDNGEQRAADIFRTQSALLEPDLERQRQQLQSDLFGSGRLGLQLSGEAAGAGTGMVQPDAYGLGLAQSRALAELSSKSRLQAQAEQQQAYQQALQGFLTNEQQQQLQAANLLGGYTGTMGAFGDIADMESALVNQGLSVEQARSVAQSASASAGSSLANAGTKATQGGGGMLSGIVGAAASSFLNPLLGAGSSGIINMFSDGGNKDGGSGSPSFMNFGGSGGSGGGGMQNMFQTFDPNQYGGGNQQGFSQGGGFLEMFKSPPDGGNDFSNMFSGGSKYSNPISNKDGGSMDGDDYWKTAANGGLMVFGLPPLF